MCSTGTASITATTSPVTRTQSRTLGSDWSEGLDLTLRTSDSGAALKSWFILIYSVWSYISVSMVTGFGVLYDEHTPNNNHNYIHNPNNKLWCY